jgi:signal transduction histidine kinase/ActR/RegA family two-component response regulator
MQSELAQVLGFDSTEMLQVIQQTNEYNSTEDLIALGKEANQNNTNLVTAQDGIVIAPQTAKEWFDLSQEIQGNAQGAVDVLNDLLNYDKIEQGTLQLALEDLNVWQLVEKAILEFKLPASSKNIDLQVSFDNQQADDKEIGKFTRARLLPDFIKGLRVIGDSVRLTQVLRNLMSNALKFTPANGFVHVEAMYEEDEPGTLQTIELQKGRAATGYKNGNIKVRVTDTGAGMSPDQVSRLFQEGIQFNVNELQAGGGSGLGLYIADGIVKQHNGTLSASSQGIGHGSTFEMSLPLWKVSTDEYDYHDEDLFQRHLESKLEKKQILHSLEIETTENNRMSGSENEEEEDDESDTHMSSRSSTNRSSSCKSSSLTNSGQNQSLALSENSFGTLRILVVDDVKSNRKLLKRLLENGGHRCDEAENGQQSVEMVKKATESGEPYDSVLLDYEMPVMDGPTAAKQIRETMKNDVNIIGITGNVLPEDVKYFRDCGANDVLAKPVKTGDLYASWAELGVCRGDPLSNAQ